MKLYIKSSVYDPSSNVSQFLDAARSENILDIDISLLINAYKEMIADYDSVPDEWKGADPDEVYPAQRAFYNKYIEFARTCKDILKELTPGSGYGLNAAKQYKIYETLKRIDYNFPYGWKRR